MVDVKNQLKLLPQLILTPQLKLTLKVLQLNTLELNEFLQQEVQSNPFLEVEFNEGGENIFQKLALKEDITLAEEFNWEDFLIKEPKGLSFLAEEPEEEPFSFEGRVSIEETLKDHLLWQLGFIELTSKEREIALYLLGNLDERGYLALSLEEIAEDLKIDKEEVERVRKLLIKLDPVGVCAINLKECLLAQLEFLGYTSKDLPFILVDKFLEKIPEGEEKLSQLLGYPLEEVKNALEIVRSLEPYPARNYHLPKNIFFEPDLRFYKEEGEWKVEVLKEKYPKVYFSPLYYKYSKNKKLLLESKAKDFLREKLKVAEYLLKALDSRYTTLYKVGLAILEAQKDFFEKGITFLKPLTLRDLAETTGLHESTISRVISHKYVDTPLGIYPLKFFFTTGYDTDKGESVSAVAIKNYIKEIIAQENPKKPYSDSEIVRILEKNYGIRIARRTVTKYRVELNIPSIRDRKK
ncbi:MAG: RNA polymerase factor sigma-54 [Caldimicrobium sp.]